MNARSKDGLESRLGYEFSDPGLAESALTHPSLPGPRNYQRLEYLGDRVLGLVVADSLYRHFASENEGELSRRLMDLVRKETLAEIAEGLGLGEVIQIAGNFSAGSREREGVMADVLEALLGAIYLDGGYDAARAVIQSLWADRITGGEARKDPKSGLQEWLQGRGFAPPVYDVIARTGPDHAPDFTVQVMAGELGRAEARGPSKQKAEIEAAEALLQLLLEGEDAGR